MTDSSDALAGVPATSYLSPRVRQYADHAKAANTQRAYRIDWDDFAGWCELHRCAPLPAVPETVAEYPGSVDMTSDEAVADLSQYFLHVRVAATISNSAGIHNQDWGGHVYVCTGLKHPWATMWPMLRHYS